MNKLFKVIYEGMDNPNFKNKYACKYGSFHIERVYEMTMEIFNELNNLTGDIGAFKKVPDSFSFKTKSDKPIDEKKKSDRLIDEGEFIEKKTSGKKRAPKKRRTLR